MFKKAIILSILLLVGIFNVSSAEASYIEDFQTNLNNWSFVDLSDIESPSDWSIRNDSLYQLSNIGEVRLMGGDYSFLGSVALFRKYYGSSFDLSFDFINKDNDAVGFVVGYIDSQNYYQFVTSNQRQSSYLLRVQKGVSSLIAKTSDYYKINTLQTIRAESVGDVLSVYLNDKLIITSGFFQEGSVGLAVVENSGVYFDNFTLTKYISTKVVNIGVGREKLLRAKKDNTIYFVKKGKKHKILNPEVFNAYGYDWNDIVTLDSIELEKYPTAHLVKAENSSSIYYINETINRKKLVPNADIFLLYDNKWEDIITISQKDLDSYNEIQVIKSNNDSTVYELINGSKKAISDPREFEALGYQWNEIVVVKDAELNFYPNKIVVEGNEVVVAGVEFDQSDLSIGEIESTVINANKYLSIKTIKKNQEQIVPAGVHIPLLEIQLTAGIQQPVVISSINIQNKENASRLSNLVVTDLNGNILGESVVNSSKITKIKFFKELFIPFNSSLRIYVSTNLNERNYAYYETLEIDSANDIETTAFISGEFPLRGDRYKVVPSYDLVGNINIVDQVVNTGLQSVRIGAKNILVNKFLFSETSGNEDVYLKKLKIYNSGSSNVVVEKIRLVDQNNKVISTVDNPERREIVFDMSKVPYVIKKDGSQVFSIIADVKSGVGGTIKFTIEKSADVALGSSKYGYALMVSDQTNFPLGQGSGSLANRLKVNDINLLAYKNSSSPTRDIIANTKNNVIGTFDLVAEGIDLNLEAIAMKINHIGSVGLDGYISIREKSSGKQLAQFSANFVDNKTRTVNLDAYPLIKNGKVYTFEILADVGKHATIIDTYQAEIISTNLRASDGSLTYHFNYQAKANIISVQKTHLVISKDPVFSDYSIPAGKDDVLIGSFKLQANIAENLLVNSFDIVESFASDKLQMGSGFENIRVYVNRKLFGTYSNLNSGPFLISKPFTIKAGNTMSITVKADTNIISDGKSIQLNLNNISAEGVKSGLIASQTGDNTSSSVVTFVKNKLHIELNSIMADAMIVANGNSQRVASYNITNQGIEALRILNFTLIESAGSSEVSYANGYSVLSATRGGRINQPIAQGNKFKYFNLPAGATLTLDVYVRPDVSTVGDEFNLILKDIIVREDVEMLEDLVVGQNIRVTAVQ